MKSSISALAAARFRIAAEHANGGGVRMTSLPNTQSPADQEMPAGRPADPSNLDLGLDLCAVGLSVIPAGRDKGPLVRWKHQSEQECR